MYPIDQIPINEIGNSVVTPTNESKQNKTKEWGEEEKNVII